MKENPFVLNWVEKITRNIHSSIRIEAPDVIYVDPFKIEEETHDGDIILITHEHYDHFSPMDIAKVARPDTILVIPESMERKAREVIEDCGLSGDNIETVEEKECSLTIDSKCSVQIETVPAYNVGKEFHKDSSAWCGYLITIDDITIYVAGDTDENPDLSGENCPKCHIALLPVGGTYTMDAKQAAVFASHIKPNVVIPTHYGSVVGTAQDGEAFKEALNSLDSDIAVVLK